MGESWGWRLLVTNDHSSSLTVTPRVWPSPFTSQDLGELLGFTWSKSSGFLSPLISPSPSPRYLWLLCCPWDSWASTLFTGLGWTLFQGTGRGEPALKDSSCLFSNSRLPQTSHEASCLTPNSPHYRKHVKTRGFLKFSPIVPQFFSCIDPSWGKRAQYSCWDNILVGPHCLTTVFRCVTSYGLIH